MKMSLLGGTDGSGNAKAVVLDVLCVLFVSTRFKQIVFTGNNFGDF